MHCYIPNALTVSRFPLSLAMLAFHFAGNYWCAFWIGFVACVTDGLDGFLARRWGCVSRFGESVDPYADKMLLWSMMCIIGSITYSTIFFVIALMPTIVIIALYDVGLGVTRYRWRSTPVPTGMFAKWKTTVLMVGLVFFYLGVLEPRYDIIFARIGTGIVWIACTLAILAAIHYLEAYMRPSAPK